MPNTEDYEVTGESLLSTVLEQRQVKSYCAITALPENSVMRKLMCDAYSVHPKVWDGDRKRGGPKQQWASGVFKMAVAVGSIII